MARNTIGSPHNDSNLNALNDNFRQLFEELGTATGTKNKLDNFLNGTGVVTTKMLQTNSVHGDIMRENGIGTRHLLDGTVTNAKLANNSVGSNNLQDNSVVEENLGPHAVTGPKIADGALTENKYGNRSVSSRVLALRSVGETHLQEGSVTSPQLGAHVVTGPKIAPESINESKLRNNSVSNRALALRSVNPNNTNFMRENVQNLFNPLTIINNRVINFNNGSLSENNEWVTSEKINIENDAVYSLSQVYYLAFRDDGDNLIGEVIASPNVSLNQVTSPSNAATMQFSIRKSDFHVLSDFICVRGNQYTFNAYGHQMDHLKLKPDTVDWDNVKFVQRTTNHSIVNIFTDYELSDKGVMMSVSNGRPVSTEATAEYHYTAFIPVQPNTYVLRKYSRHILFYDKNKIFINATSTPTQTTREGISGYGMTAPSNAAYVVINIRSDEMDEFLLQVRSNSEALRMPELVVAKHQIVDDGLGGGTDIDGPLAGKVGVAFGDSITQGGDYTRYISDSYGCNYINVGFGSTRLARTDRQNYPWKDIGMCDLADAITTGNWSFTDAAIEEIDDYYNNTSYSTIYNRLKAVNFDDVDFITMMYGTNDANNPVFEIGDKESDDTYTINGALNHILQTIITKYPHIKVYLLSPIFRQTLSGWGDGDSDNSKLPDGVYLYEIAQAIVDKAKEYHVPVKDMYNESGINRYNASHFLSDGTHPNDNGRKLMNESISRYLLSY